MKNFFIQVLVVFVFAISLILFTVSLNKEDDNIDNDFSNSVLITYNYDNMSYIYDISMFDYSDYNFLVIYIFDEHIPHIFISAIVPVKNNLGWDYGQDSNGIDFYEDSVFEGSMFTIKYDGFGFPQYLFESINFYSFSFELWGVR